MLKLAKLMGNSAVICERHYAHLAPSSLHEAVGRLNDEAIATTDTKTSTTEVKQPAAVQ
jgi:hypothetical protein